MLVQAKTSRMRTWAQWGKHLATANIRMNAIAFVIHSIYFSLRQARDDFFLFASIIFKVQQKDVFEEIKRGTKKIELFWYGFIMNASVWAFVRACKKCFSSFVVKLKFKSRFLALSLSLSVPRSHAKISLECKRKHFRLIHRTYMTFSGRFQVCLQ